MKTRLLSLCTIAATCATAVTATAFAHHRRAQLAAGPPTAAAGLELQRPRQQQEVPAPSGHALRLHPRQGDQDRRGHRLGDGRGARLLLAAHRGPSGATLGAGLGARHLLAAPCGDLRSERRPALFAGQPHPRAPGAALSRAGPSVARAAMPQIPGMRNRQTKKKAVRV